MSWGECMPPPPLPSPASAYQKPFTRHDAALHKYAQAQQQELWKSLPVLPLLRIYEFLSERDLLAASASCKDWRHAFHFHRINKHEMSLSVRKENLEKNNFLTNKFSQNVTTLRVILSSPANDYMDFNKYVLTRFCVSKSLKYIHYVPTPEYLNFNNSHGPAFIKRTILSYLIYMCKLGTLQGVSLHACGEIHEHAANILEAISNRDAVEVLGLAGFRMRTRELETKQLRPDLFQGFSCLRCLSLDYLSLRLESLSSICHLQSLQRLVLSISSIPQDGFPDLRPAWQHAQPNLKVTLNVINLPSDVLPEISRRVLTPEVPLSVLRVMFCNSINMDILRSLVGYSQTFEELLWVDSIIDNSIKKRGYPAFRSGGRSFQCARRSRRQPTPNPLIMMCWQCSRLTKVTLHGYWQSSHDLLGMARLRGDTLQLLHVSALLHLSPEQHHVSPFCPLRGTPEEIANDAFYLPEGFIKKMTYCLKTSWSPPSWDSLPEAIKVDPIENPDVIQDYIIKVLQADMENIP